MPKYECDRCGACCQGHLLVEVYDLDVMREPRLIEADSRCRGSSLDDVLAQLDEPGRCLLIGGPDRCSFLDADNLCTIYPTRPNACVGMQAGDEQCQSARRQAGLPKLQPAPTR